MMTARKRKVAALKQENRRLHAFIRVIAHKLADASEVLSNLAERRTRVVEVKKRHGFRCSECGWQWFDTVYPSPCPACGVLWR